MSKKQRKIKFITFVVLVFVFMFFLRLFGGTIGPAATLTFAIWIMIVANRKANKSYKQKKRKKYAFLDSESDFSNMLIQLIAAVIKADNKTEDSEIRFIEKSLEDYFPQERIQVLIKHVKYSLTKDEIPVVGISDYFRRSFDIQAKVQLMHLLIGIGAADGLLTKKEYALLKKIAMHMRLPHATFTQILSMFRFRHEGEKIRQKKKTYSSASRLKVAYEVLGITESATTDQIKKAYRKLAVIHHPDKVIHLGEEMQTAAKEKFQIISEAYELIKDRKGFS